MAAHKKYTILWECREGQTDTQTRVTTIHIASSTTHAKCNYPVTTKRPTSMHLGLINKAHSSLQTYSYFKITPGYITLSNWHYYGEFLNVLCSLRFVIYDTEPVRVYGRQASELSQSMQMLLMAWHDNVGDCAFYSQLRHMSRLTSTVPLPRRPRTSRSHTYTQAPLSLTSIVW